MATSADSIIGSLLQQPALIGQAWANGQQSADQHAQSVANTQLTNQDIQQNTNLFAAQAQAQQQKQAYGQWWQSYAANPTPDNLRAGIAQFPTRWKDIQDQKSALDAPARQSQNMYLGQLWHAANNGRADLVADNMQSVIDAESAAKVDTSDAERTLAMVKSGDPDALKAVKAWAQVHLAASDPDFAKSIGVGPGKFSQVGSGGIMNDETGEVVRAPDAKSDKPDYQWDAKNNRWLLKPGSGSAAPADMASGGGDAAYSRANIRGAESRGDDNATNSHGSAAGRYQFTGPTALGIIAQNPKAFPEAQGKGAAERLALARQPAVQERMMDIAEPQYRKALSAAGLPATGTNMYMAHFLGPDTAAKFLTTAQANPGASATALIRTLAPKLADQIISGNGGIFAPGQTAGGVVQEIGRRYAGANGGGSGGDGFSRPAAGPTGAVAAGPPSVINVPTAGSVSDDESTGPAYLAKLAPGRAAIVRSILDGKMAAPKPGSRFGEALAEDVARVDPTFDPSIQPARMKARADFTGNGKAAQIASSGNRLAYHLNDLWRDSRALSGPDLGWSPLSNLATGAAQSFQQAAVARYNAVLPFISGELQKLTKNGQSTEGETNKIIANLRPNQPTPVREAAIQQVVDLATGQFKPFRDQWSSAFQDKPPPVDFTPTTQKIFARIAGGGDALHVDQNGNEIGHRPGMRAGTASSAGPVRVTSIQQAMTLPKGTVFLTPDGRRKIR